MIKKILLLFVIIAFFTSPVFAQMSDDAVVSFVENAMASGKSQKDIVKELAVRGVTKEQAERIKTKYEQSQASQNQVSKSAGDKDRKRRINDSEVLTEQIDTVSVEIVDPDKRVVYGRNIFTSPNLTFAPSANLPTPVNYVLGPGDEVIIDIWGANQATIRQTISPDGTINIPDLGVISLNGMNIKQADSYMKRKLGQIYSVDGDNPKSEIKLTLGNIRTIQVNIMGEVANPGTYYLSSLSNIYHALHMSGGISDLGSLRSIQLIRKGNVIATVDIYDFIHNGKMIDTILEEGDIINVLPYNVIVDIAGNVKRPMLYELNTGETISDLLGYAAGFTGDAYTKNIRVVRKNGIQYQIFTVNEPDYASFNLMDGDELLVEAMLDRFENRLEIKGAVYRPGIYEFGSDVKTVKDLISKAEGIKGDAFTNRALITRERDDLSYEILHIDLGAILAGTKSDVDLVRNDVLYIPSIHDINDLGSITVEGEVAKAGVYAFTHNTTIEDAIMLAGGLLESASTAKIDVSRRIKNPSSNESGDKIGEVYTFSFKDGYIIDGGEGFILQPYDRVFVRKSPGYEVQKHVKVIGEVVFPGTYTMTNKEERLSELILRAGGLTKWSYVKGARLQRQVVAEEKIRMQSTTDLLSASRDSIDVESLSISKDYFVGIDLQAALDKPGSDADLVLREGDVLRIPEYINTVKISGNVMYPNVVTYSPNMKVRDYVQMAGGYGYRSKKSRAYVIYLNGTLAKAKKYSSSVVEPGCEIVIPQKQEKKDNLTQILSIATTSSSIATMMATIANIIR